MNKWLLQVLLFLSVLIPSYSFAADSDCVQDGGKVACVVAKQYWTNVYNDKAASFDELVAILRNRWCNGTYPLCDLKTYPGGTWNGLICWTASCTSAYTYKNLENGYIAFAYGALKTGCGGVVRLTSIMTFMVLTQYEYHPVPLVILPLPQKQV